MELDKFVEPYDFEKGYFSWRANNPMPMERLLGLLGSLKKSKTTVMHEILDSEKTGTVQNEVVEQFRREGDPSIGDPLRYFEKFYVPAWHKHDLFNLEVLSNFDFTSFNWQLSPKIVDIFKQLLINDARIKAHVSGSLEPLINRVRDRIAANLNAESFNPPPTESFEMSMIEEVFKAKTEGKLEHFAQVYFYGDLAAAATEVERQYSPSLKDFMHRLKTSRRNNQQAHSQYLDRELRPVGEEQREAVCRDLRLLNRLMHWAGFEEPYKRYTIEYGVVDYAFREWLFQNFKAGNVLPSGMGEKSFCLKLNQSMFFDFVESRPKSFATQGGAKIKGRP